MDNKKADPATGSTPSNAPANDSKVPLTLTPEQTAKLVNLLPPRANTARRMVKLLAEHPDSITGDINRVSSVNLGHIKRVYNPILSQAGYMLDWRYPPTPINNAYGEPSGQVLWGIYPADDNYG
ncbi:hypothetical protein [Thiothrix nivea]|uniref:Uncharacterized protein n=1 Tax=Thiothrix nivea (strain ATCC 35100 / DSM 5205 / JP2) TaxID=870187 RepID=A0A656HHL4_THINJ|nr:hypothetical protein [Thiothrix nivea]EIJ34699.1 hypothetical protein Thini_2127 [Thiothrix nivea DSM 5205]